VKHGPRIQQLHHFFDAPNVTGDSGFHRRGHAQRLMYSAEVGVKKIDRRVAQVSLNLPNPTLRVPQVWILRPGKARNPTLRSNPKFTLSNLQPKLAILPNQLKIPATYPTPHAALAFFAVNSIPMVRITASVVFSVGFPFRLNDR
jgi:hypothetical protein